MSLLWEAFISAQEAPGNRAILMRRTYPELEKSLILVSRELFPQQICKYNDQKHRWTIRTANPRKPSYLEFGFCKTDSDVFQYQSAEYGFIGFDELTHFSEFIFRYMLSRLRTTNPDVSPSVRAASNPGGVGHGWVKRFFGIGKHEPDKIFTPERTLSDPNPISRVFIPAKVTDNPYIMNNDPDYIKRLQNLPLEQRKMLLDGDWGVFAGQFFSEWRTEKHICKPFAIPRHWKVYRALDYGFGAPFCCLWFTISPNGKMFLFKEVYEAGVRDLSQADIVNRLSFWDSQTPMVVEYTVGDPSMAQHRGDTGRSPMENYASKGIHIIPGSNTRVAGWMALRNFFALDISGRPGLTVFSNCVNYIREVTDAVRDMSNVEDLDTTGSDHALDASRYFAMSRPIPSDRLHGNEPSARMDEGTRREWAAHMKLIKKINSQQNESILHGLNRE